MVTKGQQKDFTSRFAGALWRVQLGETNDNPDIYYIGQVELFTLCHEYITAWNGGSENGFKR